MSVGHEEDGRENISLFETLATRKEQLTKEIRMSDNAREVARSVATIIWRVDLINYLVSYISTTSY